MFILRAIHQNADAPVYYTGRAGDGWVSKDIREAFTLGHEAALRKSMQFNKFEPVHGLWFIVLRADGNPVSL